MADNKPNTVRVKIAVAVDYDGNWNASGWRDAQGSSAMDIAIDGVSDGEARYWVEAELPIPVVGVAQGEMSKADYE